MTERTDEALVRLARAGDKQAEEELLLRYGGMVRRRARRFFLKGGETEDLIQEGMMGLLRAVGSYDAEKENGRSFKNYADLCIRRSIIDAIRRTSGKKVVPSNALLPLESAEGESVRFDPDDGLIEEEDEKELFRSVSRILTDFEFRVFRLYRDGCSYQEICEATGKSAKSVDNALQRAKKKLQKRFG